MCMLIISRLAVYYCFQPFQKESGISVIHLRQYFQTRNQTDSLGLALTCETKQSKQSPYVFLELLNMCPDLSNIVKIHSTSNGRKYLFQTIISSNNLSN